MYVLCFKYLCLFEHYYIKCILLPIFSGDIMGFLLSTNENELPTLCRNATLLLIVLVNQYVAISNPYRNVLSSISGNNIIIIILF